MDRLIFHIDVNSAYLSWEAAYALSHGETLDYRTIPSIVGGDQEKRHGIVLAKSIPSKKFGIQTGESIFSARTKCPDLLIIPPNYARYVRASDAMVKVIREYSNLVQRYSVDEVFVDMTHAKENYMKVAQEISTRIKEELGFTVNIGIGTNKLMAKMASDFEKPDKIHTLFHDEIETKFWPLDVGDLYMVGRRTKAKLNRRGIKTIGDLARLEPDYILGWLKKPGLMIWNYANGIEGSDVKASEDVVKSVGNSTTTAFDVDNLLEAKRFILGLCETVGMRLRKIDMCGSVISVSIKNFDFMYKSHQRKIYCPTDNTNRIYEEAINLFEEMWDGSPIRLFSVSISDLSHNSKMQLSMFEVFDEKGRSLDESVDKIRDMYGYRIVERSTFLHSGIDPIIGGVMEERDYPMMKSEL